MNPYWAALDGLGINWIAVDGQAANEETRTVLDGIQGMHINIDCPVSLHEPPHRNPTESPHGIQQRLDVLGAFPPRQPASENAIVCATDAVEEELDPMAQTPVGPAEREVLHKELKSLTKLLEKLTDLEAHRLSHSRSRRTHTAAGSTGGGAHHPSSPVPPPAST